MTETQAIPLILAASGLLLILAQKLYTPPSVLFILSGIGLALVPGVGVVHLDPGVILDLLLPPLLYSLTLGASYHLFRATFSSAVLPGAALTVATIVGVAAVSRALIPELAWTPALALGSVAAIVHGEMVVAASMRLPIPRRIVDKVTTEMFVSPVIALSAFTAIVSIASSPTSSAASTLSTFVVGMLGSTIVGAVAGGCFAWLRHRAPAPAIEIAVSFSTPYAASVTAAALGFPPVAAIIASGIVMVLTYVDPQTGHLRSSPRARLVGEAFWDVLLFVLSGLLFFLIGMALPAILRERPDGSPWLVAGVALAVLGVVLGLRLIVAPIMAALPPRGDARGARAVLREALGIAWSGERSVVGVVIALTIPAVLPSGEPFPSRDLVVGLMGLLVLTSSALQGLTLVPLLRRLGMADQAAALHEERMARAAVAQVAVSHRSALEPGARPGSNGAGLPEPASIAQVSSGALDAERHALLQLREHDAIGDALLHRLLHEVDLEEEYSALVRHASEG